MATAIRYRRARVPRSRGPRAALESSHMRRGHSLKHIASPRCAVLLLNSCSVWQQCLKFPQTLWNIFEQCLKDTLTKYRGRERCRLGNLSTLYTTAVFLSVCPLLAQERAGVRSGQNVSLPSPFIPSLTHPRPDRRRPLVRARDRDRRCIRHGS